VSPGRKICGETFAGPLNATVPMMVGVKAIISPSAAVLVAYSIIATFVFGMDTVLFVVLSRDVFGTGAEGYGYLLVGLGVGGVLAAGVVTRLERRPRLGPIILAGMATYCLPTLVFLFAGHPVLAFIVQMLRGAGTLVVDVLAVTALQRSLPHDLLARVFGAFNAFLLAAVLLGAIVAPLLINELGLQAALWFSAVVIPTACLLGWPVLRRMDGVAVARQVALAPKVALLTRCDLFAEVSAGGLDQLADAATEVTVEAGRPVVREGDDADAFYVVMDGELGVASRGQASQAVTLDGLDTGDYFGEIGLIEQIPRTASVTTITRTRLLRIDGAAFLQALTESTPSPALLDGASLRLRRTHPSKLSTRAGIQHQ